MLSPFVFVWQIALQDCLGFVFEILIRKEMCKQLLYVLRLVVWWEGKQLPDGVLHVNRAEWDLFLCVRIWYQVLLWTSDGRWWGLEMFACPWYQENHPGRVRTSISSQAQLAVYPEGFWARQSQNVQKTSHPGHVVGAPVEGCVQRNCTCRYHWSTKQTGVSICNPACSSGSAN